MTLDPSAYQDIVARWGRNEPITVLEYVIASYTGRGKAAIKAAAQYAEMTRVIAEQAEEIDRLRKELNGHGR